MFRTQPATRVVYAGGKPTIINCGTGGIADYTGYYNDDSWALFVACEVKEASGPTMPASRLSKAQRDWMDALPAQCAKVCVVWPHDVEVFAYTRRGSYKAGCGLARLGEMGQR